MSVVFFRGESNTLDEYTKVVAKMLKGEQLATATDEEGVLWSDRVMSETMPYDPYWAQFASHCSQRDCVTKDMLICL